VLGVISKDVADNLSNRLCNTKSLLNKTAAYPELTWRGWNMSRCAALKKLGLCLCCGLSNVERPRVRLTYVCVCVGSFLPLYVSWQCPGLPHRLSDHRKDMGGRSQAYRCTQRKRKVMCAQNRRSVLRMWVMWACVCLVSLGLFYKGVCLKLLFMAYLRSNHLGLVRICNGLKKKKTLLA